MSKCSENAKPIAEVLTNVNTFLGGNVWSKEDISSVSNKIACNFIGELREILNIALVRSVFKRPDLEMMYKNNNYNDKNFFYSFTLTGLPEVNTITFTTSIRDPNVEQGIKKQHFLERLQLVNLDETKNTATDQLTAVSAYYDESTNFVSSTDYAYYLVNGANGIFEGAKRLRIDFNKDRTRKVTVIF